MSLKAEAAIFSGTHREFGSRPRGAIVIAALCVANKIAGGGSIPRWSASETQDREFGDTVAP